MNVNNRAAVYHPQTNVKSHDTQNITVFLLLSHSLSVCLCFCKQMVLFVVPASMCFLVCCDFPPLTHAWFPVVGFRIRVPRFYSCQIKWGLYSVANISAVWWVNTPAAVRRQENCRLIHHILGLETSQFDHD